MKQLLLAVLIALSTTTAFAGPKLKQVKGTITDHNRELLAGARVEVKGTDIVVYTDFEGEFTIEKLKPGTYDLSITLISYQELEVKEFQLSADHSDDLSFKLISR